MNHRTCTYRTILTLAMLVMASVCAVHAQGQGEAVPITTQTLRLQTTTGNEISITPPSATTGYSLVMPLTAGTDGSVLTTNGTGTLSWVLPNTTGWSLLGNSNIDSTTTFLGTTTAQPLIIKTNGTEALRVRSTGQFLVSSLGGTVSPTMPAAADRIVITGTDGELRQAGILAVVGAGIEGNAWSLSGNTTTTAWDGTSGAYLGTKSAQPLVIATTNSSAQDIRFYSGVNGGTERLRIKSTGEVVINDLSGVTPSGPPVPAGYDRIVIANSTGQLDEVGIPALFSSAGWSLDGNADLTSGGSLGQPATGTGKFGTLDGTDLRLMTDATVRMIVASDGAITMGSTLGVTGTITGSAGAAFIGTTAITGTTTINATGTASTTIGNTTAATAVTINTGTDGGLTLGGIPTGSASDDVLLLTSGNKVTKTTRSSLIAGSGWALTGNASTDSTTNFIGTTDETVGRPLIIKTDGTERMRVAGGSGFVGIGVSAPENPLHVYGVLDDPVTRFERSVGTTTGGVFNVHRVTLSSTASSVDGFGPRITFDMKDNTGSYGSLSAIGGVRSGADDTGALVMYTSLSGTLTERMRIDSDGEVGIGTASPSNTLDVSGTFRATGNSTIGGTLGVTGATTLSSTLDVTGATTINTTGTASTTIGNTTAATAVTINTGTDGGLTLGGIPTGSASDDVLLLTSGNKVTKTTRSSLIAGSGWALTGNASTDSTTNFIGTTDETVGRPLIIKTDGTERMRVAGGSGNVGIGTSAPNVRMDVDGGLATRPAAVTASGATTAITVGNRSFIVVTSDEVFSSRRLTLSDGLSDGQRLVILVLGSGGNTTYGARLETGDNNLRLSGDAGLEHNDTIELVWYDSNWFELKRSANDD